MILDKRAIGNNFYCCLQKFYVIDNKYLAISIVCICGNFLNQDTIHKQLVQNSFYFYQKPIHIILYIYKLVLELVLTSLMFFHHNMDLIEILYSASI